MVSRRVFQPDATHTRVRVTIWSWDRGGTGFSGRVEGFDSVFGHVLSCTTSKTFGPAAGTWQLALKKPAEMSTRSWLSLWRDPEDSYVLIDGQVIDGMLGMIDTISGKRSWEIAGPNEIYTVVGRDVGKAFESTVTMVNVYDDAASHSILGIQRRLIGDIDGAPGQFVNAIADAWLGNFDFGTQPFRLPPGMGARSLWALMLDRVGCDDTEIDGYYFDANLLQPDLSGRPVWSLMQEYANGLMNEMWVDLAPTDSQPINAVTDLRPALIMRRKPFPVRGDSAAWDALPLHDLRASDIAGRDLHKGGPAHRFNYWMLECAGRQGIETQAILQSGVAGGTPGMPGSIPIWNRSSIHKHGLRPWIQSTQFLPVNIADDARDVDDRAGDQASWVRLCANWLKRLHDWYSIAPMEVSGTVALARAYPEIRIGQRVRDEGVIFYVEGVTTSWQMGQRGQTQLTLTRGEREDEHLLDYVYEELEYAEPVAMEVVTFERGALQSYDETLSYFRDGAIPPVVLDERARVGAGQLQSRGAVSEGEGFTTTNDGFEASPVEGGEVTASEDAPLASRPTDSPSEADARRAFRGEPARLDPDVVQQLDRTFGQEALEGGETIPTDSPDMTFTLDETEGG
jgi:hypothetical protein